MQGEGSRMLQTIRNPLPIFGIFGLLDFGWLVEMPNHPLEKALADICINHGVFVVGQRTPSIIAGNKRTHVVATALFVVDDGVHGHPHVIKREPRPHSAQSMSVTVSS